MCELYIILHTQSGLSARDNFAIFIRILNKKKATMTLTVPTKCNEKHSDVSKTKTKTMTTQNQQGASKPKPTARLQD